MDADRLKLAAAHAVVASAAVFGDDPARSMVAKSGPIRQAVLPAAIGLAAAASLPLQRAARLLGCSQTRISEVSMRPTKLQALAIREATKAAAAVLDAGRPSPPDPAPPAASARVPEPTPPPVEAVGLSVEVRAKTGAAFQRAREVGRIAGAKPSRRPARAVNDSAVVQLKALTPGKLRYAGWFVAADWSVEETAGLFDLDPDQLADALEGQARGLAVAA